MRSLINLLTAAIATLCVFIIASTTACSLQRSATGCGDSLVGDETGRCAPAPFDAGDMPDAVVMLTDGEIDSGTDAGFDGDAGYTPDTGQRDSGPDADDAGSPDAGTDSGPPDSGTFDAGSGDAGPPDAGTDACVPRAEVCGNGVDEDCSGADLPCPPLHIDFSAATMPTGIAFRVVWSSPPPIGRQESAWYYHNCTLDMPTASRVEAQCDAPELLPGRMLQFFPYDDSAGAAMCSVAICPSLCDRASCPGFVASYGATYESRPVLPGEFVFNTDPGTASDGPAPGDTAWIHFTIP